MAFKFPDKDPDEKLDYTVDWSRYLTSSQTIYALGSTWRIQNSKGLYLEFGSDKTFQFDYVLDTANAGALLNENVTNSTTISVTPLLGATIQPGHQLIVVRPPEPLTTVIGVGDNIYVTEVDGGTVTLSSAVTILTTDSLTFSARGLSMNSEEYDTANDKATIVLSKGIANTTYRLLCQIQVNNEDGLITNREINLRVRERS